MRIALLGDAHGDLALLAARVAAAAAAGAGAAIQLGDLGFRPDLLGPGRPWPRLPIPLLAVDGNHEDHDFLRWAHANGLADRWAAHGLCHMRRGSVVRLGGRSLGFVGGAMHADRAQDAGLANCLAPADIDAAVAAFSVRPPELIVSHSCPAGIGIGMHGAPALAMAVAQHVVGAGLDPGPAGDVGEPLLTRLWQALPRRPTAWAFGHFHVSRNTMIDATRFVCVGSLDGEDGGMAWWDSD